MKYWLMKSEPNCYSIDDLAAEANKTTHWDGVRNYQARNFMREMAEGDLGFFYHSSCKVPGIVGVVEVVKEAYPDHTAWDPESGYYDPKSSPDNPRWIMVDVKFKRQYADVISLQTLRTVGGLEDMALLQKGSRLSIQPVAEAHWQIIESLAQARVS